MDKTRRSPSLRRMILKEVSKEDGGKSTSEVLWDSRIKLVDGKLEKAAGIPSNVKSVIMKTFAYVKTAESMDRYNVLFQTYISEDIENKCIQEDLDSARIEYYKKYCKMRGFEIK